MKVKQKSEYTVDTEQLRTEIAILKDLVREKEFELEAAITQATLVPSSVYK